jgi:pilus assembly protein CpaE
MFSSGLRLSDLQQTLGDAFTAVVPNDYALVREAIDRGVPLDEVKPGNKISAEIKKLVAASIAAKPAPDAKPVPIMQKLKLAAAK